MGHKNRLRRGGFTIDGQSLASVAMALLVAGALVGTAAARGPSGTTVYGVVTKAQFVNTADGVVRGDLHNPFNVDTKALAPAGSGKGPLPGDTAFFALKLYSHPDRGKADGSASYTCTYDFNQNGICEANVTLGGGTMFATGPVNFAGQNFTLAVTGGTGAYLGVRGELIATQVAHGRAQNETRLRFVIFR